MSGVDYPAGNLYVQGRNVPLACVFSLEISNACGVYMIW